MLSTLAHGHLAVQTIPLPVRDFPPRCVAQCLRGQAKKTMKSAALR